MRWELVESDVYALCVSQLGGAKFMDRALAALIDGLSLNPRGFPQTGVRAIRLAKTRLIFLAAEVIPALNLRFRITEPHTVELLHLEICPPEDMFSDQEG